MLDRELHKDSTGLRLEKRATLYANLLGRGRAFLPELSVKNRHSFAEHANMACLDNVDLFDIDSRQSRLAYGSNHAGDSRCWAEVTEIPFAGSPQRLAGKGATRSLHNSELSSINYTPNGSLVSTSYGASNTKPQVIFIPPGDASVQSQFALNPETCWDSAAKPCNSGPEEVAVGTSEGLGILTQTGFSWSFTTISKSKSDMLAVGWLNPNVVSVGARNGKVFLFDSRVQQGILRIAHDGPVLGIKQAGNESELVISGARDNLNLYDLRMMPKKDRKTRSLFRFDGYENSAGIRMGLEVLPEVGLLAAANESAGINLFSLRTGALLRELDDFKCRKCTGKQMPIKCIRWVDDPNGDKELVAVRHKQWVQWGINLTAKKARIVLPCSH